MPKGRLPSLDGWRAIAITMVMLTHFWAANNFHRDGIFVRYVTLQGTLGVRIFFVLSGFLITYLLLIEHQKTNKISLRDFYIRRVLRIFPVYFCYLLVLLSLALAGFYHNSLLAWIGAFTFTRDLIGQGRSATGHFWSLAVEEQFYVAWPIVLVAFDLPRRRRLAIAILASVMVICFLARLVQCDEPTLVCRTILRPFSPLMYMDSIAVGCLAAVAVTSQRALDLKNRTLRVAAIASAIMLIASTTLIDLENKLLISTVVTCQAFLIAVCIVASATAKSGLAFWFLNRPIVVKLGLISYSLYVWHLMFLSYFIGDWAEKSSLYDWRVWWIWPLLIACVSFYCFETPILGLKRRFSSVAAQVQQSTVGP